MATTRVTVELPTELLEKARNATGEGVTGTICRGLELVAAARAQDALKGLRGKVKFSLDMAASRDDER